MSYAGADPFLSGCVNALSSFQDACNYVGANLVGMVYGCLDEASEFKSNKALMHEAEALGKKLLSE
jgi:hypothetical protein